MTKVSRTSLATISVTLLFLVSAISVPAVMAAPSKVAAPAATPLTTLQANWAAADGNAFNQNYNPQNQINSSNAQNLGLNWLFPLPTHPTALLSVSGGLGIDSAPLTINGTIYAITQFGQIFAINAANGNQIWTTILPILPNATAGIQGITGISLHLHDGAEQFTTKLFGGTPTLWYAAPGLKVWAVNANTGALEMNFTYFTGINMVQGNAATAIYSPIAPNVLVDQNRGLAITSIGSPSSSATGRCFYTAWNILVNPPQRVWTTYCTPPQVNSNLPVNPNWDIQQVNNMTGAEIFYPGPAYNGGGTIPGTAVVNLKTMSAAQLNSTLYNDWGYVQSAACTAADGGASPGSTAAGWGAPWILGSGPLNDMVFVNTNNRDPYTNACMPGPDLWSASVLALNETNGHWIWGFQTSAHENWDYDCSWWQAVGNETINGVNTPVLWKTCKNGYLYELNALNGNMIWAWTPPQSILARCPYCYSHNPLNSTEMNEAFFNPSLADTLMYPQAYAGFENEPAVNTALNMVFTASQNVPALAHYIPMNITNYGKTSGWSSIAIASTAANLDNSTIEGVNAATGQMVWSHFIPTQGYRGGLTTSGNLVMATLSSGDLLMLNAGTGAVVKDFFIGGPLNELATFAATASGQEEVIFPITAGLVTWGTGVPGDLVALSLTNVQATGAGTTTTTTVTSGGVTVTSTVGGGGTTVTTTSTTVKTTTVGGSGSTVTLSGSATTVTSTATSTGVSSTTLYGVAAVAVIFIIATGYLAMRGRKPAS
ncbi:MAG TPA: hypothetical protein VLX56_00175 [Nitrososphaerales archaeon]|nr:hypothetical protein [Nitrososphaerales archaeon]